MNSKEVLNASVSDYDKGYNDALDKLQELMYYKVFEEPNGMTRWDSGCWIRYKLFEKCLEEVRND